MQVDAVYENGVLRPVQPLDLTEHELVTVEILKTGSDPIAAQLDLDCIENIRRKVQNAGPAPGLEEVRRRLSKIPGSMTQDFIAEREDS
jgi:predicted DNA-binding antitoxin AbrB/MazE fold protein